MTNQSIKTAMTGASGFVGGNLIKRFKVHNWSVTAIERVDFEKGRDRIRELLQGSEVVINLAGAPIIGKWTEQYKKVLIESRINTTRMVVDSMASIEPRPKVFISTSAVGIYSDKGTHTEENCQYADDFLCQLAKQWEAEALRAEGLGVRTVIFRFGIILGSNGGALSQMLPPFRLGLGGTIGDGSQAFSWIHIDDLVNAYVRALTDSTFSGIYNLTSPNPITNRDLTKALSEALHRPALFRVPEIALRLKFGEGAQVLTKGQRVLPERLLKAGFVFSFPDIKTAIEDILKKT